MHLAAALLAAITAFWALFLGPRALSDERGDPVAGEKLFSQCSACHQVGMGAQHRIGPHLNNLFGRRAASHEVYGYSKSLQSAGANGLDWKAETLDRFLENPQAIASGNRMNFSGLTDPQERRDLIAYLRRFSDGPPSLSAASAPGSDLDPAILALKGDADYGAYLSGECTACHQASGASNGIPSIVRWPEEAFVIAMHAYKTKRRNHPVMQMVAGRLGNDEIAALAAYFAHLD